MSLSRPLGAALLAGALALSVGPAAVGSVGSVAAGAAPRDGGATAARSQESSGSLAYSPQRFVGGQALTLSGSLPVAGAQPIRLEQHMNRPGDSWFDVRDFSGRTAADGSFRFQVPAPSMFGISYRVVGGGTATEAIRLSARSQDLTLHPVRTSDGFDIEVDTTPTIVGKPETQGLPVFVGRVLTLQRRDPATYAWQDAGTGEVGPGGAASFSVTRAGWYRVRQEAITHGRNRIGWYPSFPTPVGVAAPDTASGAAPRSSGSGGSRASATAASTHRWGSAAYDFAWERAESLTAGPAQGTDTDGYWEDLSTGTGRVAQLNGGLALESGRERRGGSHAGDTSATLRGSAMAYGRWETRLREILPGGSRTYTYRVELVPEGLEAGRCGSEAITLGELGPDGTLRYGVRRGERRWTGSRRIGSIQHAVPALAVEVGPSHISWFLDGRLIGTVANRAAVSSTPRTLRLSLLADGDIRPSATTMISDWQRGYALRGQQTRGGRRLAASTVADGGC